MSGPYGWALPHVAFCSQTQGFSVRVIDPQQQVYSVSPGPAGHGLAGLITLPAANKAGPCPYIQLKPKPSARLTYSNFLMHMLLPGSTGQHHAIPIFRYHQHSFYVPLLIGFLSFGGQWR